MKKTYIHAPLVLAIAAASAPAMAKSDALPVSSAASALAIADDEAAIELAERLDAIAPDAAAGSETIALESTATGTLGASDFALTSASASASAAATAPASSEIAVTAAAAAAAQGETGGRSDSFTVTLNQDAFFGFYPAFNGLIPISDNVDFSFYGIIWTTDAFGTGLGSDLWTEFGAGVAIYSGDFVIKPQIGITNGALLSGGVLDANDVPTGTGGNFADGIVPSLTVNYSGEMFEAEFYGGYYAALRNRNDDAALDFLHTWINAGYKFSDNVSAGAHYELLSNTRNTFPGGSTAVAYQWVGPYVQFSTDNGFFARFTAGADIEDGNDGDFYKLTAGFSF
ncbi:DUF6733 family protein [Erythrobacter sp.]|uniref:DUF6733 family protein n=1 Tax=Erythrobacter sp. TaxID=1042 RepID=UPI001425D155|nr:DUF6733 family protein [Erythrobacter sp.]QIQ85273.1 MAG: hypothetical protein G9473_00210 [Erythrobacter sp.]